MLGEDLPRIRQEIEAMKVLRHQNICQLLQVNNLKSVYWRYLTIKSLNQNHGITKFSFILINIRR